MEPRIPIDRDRIAAFCAKWKIKEFSFFGSVITPDFRPDSDVDVLVTFQPEAPWSLWEWIDMIDELKEMFGREVDLVEEDAIRNPFRRHSILSSKQVIHAA